MTKRREVIERIATAAERAGADWVLIREGGNHTVYRLGFQRRPIIIGRHTEFGVRYAETVYRQCEETLGKGWWR